MKVYKEKQFLVFDFEDGATVKYDFAKHEAIGKKGKPVKNLKGQLRKLRIDDLIECCSDQKYARFIQYVLQHYERDITNIGTALDVLPKFAKHEQLFSAGLTNIEKNFKYTIADLPSGIIKLCRRYGDQGVELTTDFADFYNMSPDIYNIAFQLEYVSLLPRDIYYILTSYVQRYEMREGKFVHRPYIVKLIKEYGYQAKALMQYIDYLKTYEALDDMCFIMRELADYCHMMYQINPHFDKYPKHFLTTFKIASRNYNRLKQEFDEAEFKKRINPEMEYRYNDFVFIYPKSTDEIKGEAVQQNNCVASYIARVIKGDCDILFMRNRDTPEKSLVTIQVVDGRIVQSRQRYNYPCTASQDEAIEAWNKWYQKKLKAA